MTFPQSAPAAWPVFLRSYSRRLPTGARETYQDVVDRNLAGLEALGKFTPGQMAVLRHHQESLTALPAGRWLWVGGTPWVLDPRNFSGAYNCLGGDTRVLTREGHRTVRGLATTGETVEIVNAEGRWTPVQFRSFGLQPVATVTFARKGGVTKTVQATLDHDWLTESGRVQTKDLRPGTRIERRFAPKPAPDPAGIRHGIVYGDGTSQRGRFFVDLCGDKVADLSPWFDDVRELAYQTRAYPPQEGDLKSLPFGFTPEYLRGFILGLLATDGSVCRSIVSISGSAETVAFIREHAPSVGYGVNGVHCLHRAGEDSNLGRRNHDIWAVHLCAASVGADDCLRLKHRTVLLREREIQRSFWTVKEVTPAAPRSVEVFCCEEPETHAFLLADGLLTGNCTSTSIDSFHSLSLLMDLAMMGAGTGAMLEEANVAALPKIANKLEIVITGALGTQDPERRVEETKTYVLSGPASMDSEASTVVIVVGDSRSGWVRAFRQVLDCAADPLLSSKGSLTLQIDLSSVRPPGERLAGFGGVSNPSELPGLFARLAAVLGRATGRKLTALECCLLIDEAARTIVAGNIRRSAGIRQFGSGDEEAHTAKDNLWKQDAEGNWSIDPERDALRMANHTRVFHHKPSYEEVLDSVTRQHRSGEGAIQYAPEAIARANCDLLPIPWLKSEFLRIYSEEGTHAARAFLSHLVEPEGDVTEAQELDHRMHRYGLNPCGEIIGHDFHCDLAEVHLNQISPDDNHTLDSAFRAAALSVCALLHHEFREPRYRDSRALDPIVGVSFTGLFDHFALKFGTAWLQWWAAGRPPGKLSKLYRPLEAAALRHFREVVEAEVSAYCNEQGLKIPNRCTTVQPAGTKSLLTGASPGWHPPKATRFIRRVTFAKNDPIALACVDYGFTIVPGQSDKDGNGRLLDDPFDPRCTEWLVEMPVEVSWASMPGAEEIDPNEFSALAQFDFYMQVQRYYAGHNVSATIELREDEIEPLAKAIHAAIDSDRGYISAALLARSDCHAAFPRMPYEAIDKAAYELLQAEVLTRRGGTDFMEALIARDRQVGAPALEAQGPAGCDSAACFLPLAKPG